MAGKIFSFHYGQFCDFVHKPALLFRFCFFECDFFFDSKEKNMHGELIFETVNSVWSAKKGICFPIFFSPQFIAWLCNLNSHLNLEICPRTLLDLTYALLKLK